MPLTKIVNGLPVPMTPQEEADIQALWDAAAATIPARQAEDARIADIDTQIAADTFGNPAVTIHQLAAMSFADFNTWWNSNVTNAAQAIQVLKRLTYFTLRRARA